MEDRKYVIDASVIIDAAKLYPMSIEMFNGLWQKFEELFEDGRLISSIEIYDEVKDEDAQKWISKYKKCFLPLSEEVQKETTRILKENPKMINIEKGRKSSSNGDPFLIATAIVNNGVIVTNEKKAENKIPNVAQKYGIESINLTDFIKEIL